MHPAGRVACEPNSLSETSLPGRRTRASTAPRLLKRGGGEGRIRAESFADHYNPARPFYLNQTPYEQTHIVSALVLAGC